MMALLEDSFSSKWEEYTSKTVESASAVPLYTKQYGKLTKETLGTGFDPNSASYWNKTFTDIIYNQMNKFKFTSRNVYFIHCCARFDNIQGQIEAQYVLIDNYGYAHNLSVNNRGEGYPNEPITIDITKPKHGSPYIYPLNNVLIDSIKTMPYAVNGVVVSSNQYGTATHSGGDIHGIKSHLPKIREAAALFHEQATATEKLLNYKKSFEATLAENKAMKARITELEAKVKMIEASAPTEDLLGLTGSNECAAGGCGEPSKNN